MEKGQGKRMDTLQIDKVFTRKEYIEREAVFDALFGQYCASCDETEQALNTAIEEIKAIPAAEVVPVVRGHWIQRKENDGVLIIPFVSCSLCHYAWDFETPFCPNCGARMDGDGDV